MKELANSNDKDSYLQQKIYKSWKFTKNVPRTK